MQCASRHPKWHSVIIRNQSPKNRHRNIMFGGDMAAHCGRQWAHQFYLWHDWYILFTCWHCKYLPICLMDTNSQYWWRYCHLLLVTVVNSEQDILHSDGIWSHFLHSNIMDECIYSDSKNCPNVWHFLIVCGIASYADQTEPKCWCMRESIT